MKVISSQIRVNLNGEVELDRGPYIGWVPLGEVLEELMEKAKEKPMSYKKLYLKRFTKRY